MNINSVLNQSSRAIGFGNNIKSQKSQNTGFEASQPITVYMLNEKCIETYEQWQEIAPTPDHYQKNVEGDFKTIDLSVIENIVPRLV